MPGATAFTVMPRLASSSASDLRRAVQRALGGGVVRPARGCRSAPATDVMLMMRPQRVRIIGSSSGCVTLKKPLQRHVDHALPLLGAHAGEHRVVVDAGVVDEHLDRPGRQQLLAAPSALACASVTSKATASAEPPSARISRRHRLAPRPAGVGVHDHVQAVAREPPADRARRWRRCRR